MGARCGRAKRSSPPPTPHPPPPLAQVLASKYDDLSTLDKLAATTKKVQDVQRVMADNMVKASERDSLLSGLNVKSEELASSSKKMFQSATTLKRKARCACVRTYAYAILCVVLLLAAAAAVVLGLNYGDKHWWGGNGGSSSGGEAPAASPSP